MSFCCSQCNFTAQFESALIMHHQLHHESSHMERLSAFDDHSQVPLEKSATLPSHATAPSFLNKSKSFRRTWISSMSDEEDELGRSSSATRLFSNLKTKICRSRMLFSHSEEPESSIDVNAQSRIDNRPTSPSDCTSKALKSNSVMSHDTTMSTCLEDCDGNTFPCHLCNFEADRITILDRHLLNHHKIGLENLLKLVMAKTKDGLSDDRPPVFGIRQPYYKPQDEMMEEGEFIIETVAPKIKILKHSSTNTDNSSNLSTLASDIEQIFKAKQDGGQNGEQDGGNLMSKMAALNQYMCKFVDSSNTLKKVLNQELDMKDEHLSGTEPMFALGLGDRVSPRDWDLESAHSDKMERNRKFSESSRGDKDKMSANSYYF